MVLTGEIKAFPRHTWDQPDSIEYAAEIIRFLIEKILNWSDEDLKKNLSIHTFMDHKLTVPFLTCFNASPIKAIMAAYPGKFKEWEFALPPRSFWMTPENRVKAIKWLFEEKLQWTDDDIKKNLRQQFLLNMVYQAFYLNILIAVRFKPSI